LARRGWRDNGHLEGRSRRGLQSNTERSSSTDARTGNGSMSGAPDPLDATAWKDTIVGYQRASTRRALWQLTNTFAPYVLLWYAMYWALEVSIWLTVPLALLSGALLVRIFIIFHDCAHGSYLSPRRANDGSQRLCNRFEPGCKLGFERGLRQLWQQPRHSHVSCSL